MATPVSSSVLVSCTLASSSSVTWSLPSVVFSVCPLVWSSSFSGRSSRPLSSSDSSVPSASVVSGVASAALVEGSEGSSSHGISSMAPLPEDSVGVFSDPLAFPDGDDPELKARGETQEPSNRSLL